MNYYDGQKVHIKDYVACHGILGTVIADFDAKEYLNDTIRKKWEFLEKEGGILIKQDNGELSHLDTLTPYQPVDNMVSVSKKELELVLIKRGNNLHI